MNHNLLNPETRYEGGRIRPLSGLYSCLIGGAIWVVVVGCRQPAPFALEWGQCLLLLGPLVLVPLGLHLVQDDTGADGLGRLAAVSQAPAALALVGASCLPPGWTAGLLALPWLLVTLLIAAWGVVRARRRRSAKRDLWCNIAFLYLAVGGGWVVFDRLGARPLDFAPVIVLLTGIHFHFAGFVLPLCTGLALRQRADVLTKVTAVMVIAGVPLVAAGITATQLGWGSITESATACFLATAGGACAAIHLRLAWQESLPRKARLLFDLAGTALLFSMIFAGLYGLRFIVPLSWLDIPWMRAWPGTANALGFSLPALLGWALTAHAACSPKVGG